MLFKTVFCLYKPNIFLSSNTILQKYYTYRSLVGPVQRESGLLARVGRSTWDGHVPKIPLGLVRFGVD
jgi:hypothetical protein